MSVVRGAVLSPLPDGGLRFQEDAVLRWDAQGRLSAGEGSAPPPAEPVLWVPGFVDAHIHLPQVRVRGRFQDALLPWLREHIWPEEARFAERSYRDGVTAEFRDGLLAAGTTAAMVYGSPLGDSAHAVLRDLAPLCVKGGDVLMDRNSPPELTRPAEEALAEARGHAARYGERYVLTPRFVPTCSAELMAGCGELLAAGEARLQTHLSENPDEVAWVRELHPDLPSYTAVYAHFGLVGPRSVFGHCIHLDDEELALLARGGAGVAHCPTSNLALGSGRMPVERVEAAGIRWALATDVGAGPDLSMLDVMAAFLEVHRGAFDARPTRALRAATLDGAALLGEPRRGAIAPGFHADLVALRVPGGLRRGEDPDALLGRILREFAGRWPEAIAEVRVAGRRPQATKPQAEPAAS